VKTGPLVEGIFELAEFDDTLALADGELKGLIALAQPRTREQIHG
jgi:hypothetical protein